MTALAGIALPSAAGGLPADWRVASWRRYLERFVQADGRVIDPYVPPGVTTSEGQAYTLLRAVWMGDRSAFDRVLRWTRDNLVRPGSPLSAWKWGNRKDGSWGTLDSNTAADADVVLAFALRAAGALWDDASLGRQALAVAEAIWNEEVGRVHERWYLLPGNWAKTENPTPLNPSYYSPALIRRLAAVDRGHPWAALAETTYHLLRFRLPTTRLPSDWLILQPLTREPVVGSRDESLQGRFGRDAWRVYFNLALDYAWDRSPPALEYLRDQHWLVDFLRANGTLPREVGIDAVPMLRGPEPVGLYASLYPMLVLLHREASHEARTRLAEAYADGLWGDPNDYYAQNLVWFGLSLGEGLLPPLPPEAAREGAVASPSGGGEALPTPREQPTKREEQ